MSTQTVKPSNKNDNDAAKVAPHPHPPHHGENYSIRAWGPPYFDVNSQGHVAVQAAAEWIAQQTSMSWCNPS